ncbi:uncharacterized protein [Acropora muricata]|uniref:uncharacterized protein n=1 Tax=Acropora muricata TaxID=159855 RepID=UPI0034E404E1
MDGIRLLGLLALLLKFLDCSASYIGAYIPEDCNDTRLILITNETVNSFNIPFKTSLRKDNASLSNELLLQGNETTWCFNNSASYLEINFTEQYEICAIETQGILGLNNDTLLLSSYVLEAFVSVSTNQSIWMFYNGTGNTTVFEGNAPEDPFTKRKNYVINANLTASVIRIWPLLSNGSCTQFKLYGLKGSFASNGAAHAQIQTYILEVRNRSATSLFIRWAPPVNASVDGYRIKLIYSNNGEQLFDVNGTFTDLIVSRLYRHSKYCVTVSVIIGETVGNESDPPLCAFTAIDVPSDAPENLTISQVTNSSLVLGWDHKRSYFNSKAVVGFALKVKHSNVLINNLTVPALPEEKHISGLNKSTRYCMTVTAILGQGGTGLESGESCESTHGQDGVEPCKKTGIGLENGLITDAFITSSSHAKWYEPFHARLNYQSAWCKNLSEPSASYIQINTNATHLICAIATQGTANNSYPSFVKEYKLEFSFDGAQWDFYQGSNGTELFQGNNDAETIQKNALSQTVYAQYVRIWPTQWSGNVCMRIEIYGRPILTTKEKKLSLLTSTSVSNIGIHSLSISWKKPPLYQALADIKGFKVIYRPLASFDQTEVTITLANANVTKYKMTGLERNETYCVRVLAYNEYGDGEASHCLNVTTAEACLQGWIQFNSDCYLLVKEVTKNWTDAEVDCLDRNSELLNILTSAEDQFIFFEMLNKSMVYEAFIGLRESGDSLRSFIPRSNKAKVGFTNWQGGSPGIASGYTSCGVKMGNGSGQWALRDCALSKPYICKRKGFEFNNSLCEENAIGMENEFIPNTKITASSHYPERAPWTARLGAFDGWRPSVPLNSFLQVDLGVIHYVCAVATQGDPVIHGSLHYVVRYSLQLSVNDIDWTEYEQKFFGDSIPNRVKKYVVKNGVVTKLVRFHPEVWQDYPVLRVEIYGTPASPLPAPTAAPTILFAHATSSSSVQFLLSPPRVYYAVFNVIGYIVQFHEVEEGSTSNGETYIANVTLSAGNTTAIMTGLKAYREYCLSAQLINSFGAGPLSNCTNVSTMEDVPDQPPAEINAIASSSTSITVTWGSVPSGHENGIITGYRILYIDQANSQPKLDVTVDANMSYIELKDLLVYTNYCVEVLAFTSQGDGIRSPCVNTSTGESVPRSPPTNVTAQSTGNTSLIASWKPVPPGHEQGIILGYKIVYADTAQSQTNTSIIVCSSILSVNLTSLQVYTNYCVQVLAFTMAGEGVLSECVVARTDEGVPSASPTVLSATMELHSVLLSWNPVPLESMNGKLTAYVIQVQDTGISLYVGSCLSSHRFKRRNFSIDSCFQIAALTKVGHGQLTDCIKFNTVFDTTPMVVTASKETNPSSIEVAWVHPQKDLLGSHLRGYSVKYQMVRQGGDLIAETDLEATAVKEERVDAIYSEVILKNLSSYTTYKIEVAPITSSGIGKSSEPVYGETCRCMESLSTQRVPNILDSSGNNSLSEIIKALVTDICGHCKENTNGDTTELIPNESNQTTEPLISFPVTMARPFGDTAYSKFVPVIKVPGVIVLRRKGSNVAKLLTERTVYSIVDAWPMFLITLLASLLAGIIVWFLDSRDNEEQFPRPFLKGAGEGFWWSFISMTTVGYGDRCPQSIPAKIFAMAWFLVGLCIFTIFMGFLTTTLTVTIVKKDSNVHHQETDDGKVAVVSGSSEYLLAVNKFRDRITIGSNFPDTSSMLEALRNGTVSAVLLDMYVPVARKDLFNETLYEVNDLLEAEIQHGVLLRGDSVKLASTMKKSISENNVQFNFLKVAEPLESSESESTSANVFEPSSPYYFNTVVLCAALLLFGILCGLVYQQFYFKRFIGKDCDEDNGPCSYGATKKEIDEMVETFYQNISTIYRTLGEKHRLELRRLAIRERKTRGSKA